MVAGKVREFWEEERGFGGGGGCFFSPDPTNQPPPHHRPPPAATRAAVTRASTKAATNHRHRANPHPQTLFFSGVDFVVNIACPNIDFATVHIYPDNWLVEAWEESGGKKWIEDNVMVSEGGARKLEKG